MGYLLAQIFFCLLLAFALGLIIGWFLRSRRRDEAAPGDDRALADARARIATLERDLADCRGTQATAPAAFGSAASGSTSGAMEMTATQEAPLAAASGAAMGLFGASAEAPVDDLKVISGVGPVIETQLAGIGITTYRQIADLTPEDVERVNDAIEVFQGRIEREEWISQAAKLHREKYGTDA